MVVCWELALKEQVPKNLFDLEKLHQNEVRFDDNNCLVGINTCNFIRDLQWNNTEKENNAIPDSVFRFWDQKDLMEMLFSCMESNDILCGPHHPSFPLIWHYLIPGIDTNPRCFDDIDFVKLYSA